MAFYYRTYQQLRTAAKLIQKYNHLSMSINTLLIQFTLLRNTSFWFQFSQCNKDLYTVIGIFESKMSGFMLHLGP